MQTKIISMEQTQIINYNVTDASIAELKIRVAETLMEWDGKDFEIIKAAKREVLKLRTGIEPLRKEYVADALEYQRKINAEAKRVVTTLEAIEKPLDDILEAEKARIEAERLAKIKAEQERVAAIQSKIALIRELPLKCVNKSITYINETLAYFDQIANDSFDYEELSLEATIAKRETLAKLNVMSNERIEFETKQAEALAAAETLKALQEAEANRQAEEARLRRTTQEAEDRRLIEERRKFAEEQQRIRLENATKEASLAEQQRKLDEEQEKLRLQKEIEEKRKFEEIRVAECEKQVAVVSIIPASNEEVKIYIDPAHEGADTVLEAYYQNGEFVAVKDLHTETVTPYGILLAFVEEIILAEGKYSYLNDTQIIVDAYEILRQIEGK